MMNKILLVFFCFTSQIAVGQFDIKGRIQDDQKEPASFANIVLLSEKKEFIKGEVADKNGDFIFEDIADGDYILNITFIGFQEFQKNIKLAEDVDLGSISISPNSVTLEGVTVVEKKAPYVRKPDRMVVNVASLPTAEGSNALELIEKSPSVRLDRVTGNIALLGRDDVLVFLNGKRARLTGNELMQFLQTIPAANIETLELINNPPASYDADGTGGIIDIVFKNYEMDGITANLSTYGGYGTRWKYGGTANVNYKSGKLNIYSNASVSEDFTIQNTSIDSRIRFDNGTLASDLQSNRPAFLGNYNGKIGFSYDLSDNTSIDVFGLLSRRRWKLNAETSSEYSGELFSTTSDFLISKETNTTNRSHISSRLSHKFKNGHTLSGDFDILNFNITNPASYEIQNFDSNNQLLNEGAFGSEKFTPMNFTVSKLDYKTNVSEKINFEFGLKLTQTMVENKTNFIDNNGTVELENPLTDEIDLNENIYASYLSLNGNLGNKNTFVLGLRYEYSDLNLTANRDSVNRQLGRFFPSLSISRSFNEQSKLTLAYRERITRPGFQILAPSFFFLNPYTVLSGDVQVLPNINRTIEAILIYKTLYVSLNYSFDNKPLGFAIPVLNQDENLLLLISDNLKSRKQLSLNVVLPIKVSKFWDSNYSLGCYWRRDEIEFSDAVLVESHPFFTFNGAQTFKLKNNWAVELSGRWFSKAYQSTIYFPQQFSFNLGVQKKLKNATIGLSWTDIYNTGSFWNPVNSLPSRGIEYNWNYDLEGSIFRIAYSYKFGGKEAKKLRNSGAADVINRAN